MAVRLSNSNNRQPFDWRVDKQDPGISGWWQGIAGGLSDLGRGAANSFGDLAGWLMSTSNIPVGNVLFGPDSPESSKTIAPTGPWGMAASPEAVERAQSRSNEETSEPQRLGFADYLQMARSMGGGPADYSGLLAAARSNAAAGDARLAGLYSQLVSDIAGDRPDIQSNYDMAIENTSNASQNARDLITAAYASALQKRDNVFDTLGLGEDSGSLGADEAASLARILENQNSSQNRLEKNRSTALNYNTNIGEASQQQGAEARASLQQALVNRLAEINMAQQEANRNYQSNILSNTLSLAGNAGLIDPVVQQDQAAQQEYENQLAARKFALEQKKVLAGLEDSNPTLDDLVNTQASISTIAQQMGLDPNNADDLQTVVKLLSGVKSLY